MKVCFDTCVIIDIFTDSRFFKDSFVCYDIVQLRNDDAMMSLHSTADIDYILHRRGFSKDEARTAVLKALEMFDHIDVISADAASAAASDMPDYEDALIAYSAKRAGAQIIITRDKGFANSPVPTMTPTQYVEQFCPANYVYDLIDLN